MTQGLSPRQRLDLINLIASGRFEEVLKKYGEYFTDANGSLLIELGKDEGKSLIEYAKDSGFDLEKGYQVSIAKKPYIVSVRLGKGKAAKAALVFTPVQSVPPAAEKARVGTFVTVPAELVQALISIAESLAIIARNTEAIQTIAKLQETYVKALRLYDTDNGGKAEAAS